MNHKIKNVKQMELFPNEILTEIQKHADLNTARNMASSSSHLKSEFDRSDRKKCWDFIEFIFTYHLFNPIKTCNIRSSHFVSNKGLGEIIGDYTEKLCNNVPMLKERVKEYESVKKKYDNRVISYYALYIEQQVLCNFFLTCVPFFFGPGDEDYMQIFTNFIRGKDYRVVNVYIHGHSKQK